MKDPIVVRINKFMTRDDFRHAAAELKQENPDIIVIPAEYELLYPEEIPVIRCKDCKYYSAKPEYHWGICEAHGNPPHVADETDWCSWAKRKEDGTL